MALSFPVSLPATDEFSSVIWQAKNVVAVTESPFSLVTQTHKLAGEKWACSATLISLRRSDAEKWSAFLTGLEGRRGTFLMDDPVSNNTRGSAKTTPGTPVVDGNDQTGPSLDIRGAPTNSTGYLLAGDLIQLGSGGTTRMHKVLQNVDIDGSGEATIEIWPSIRTPSPTDGDTVTVDGAQCLMRLTTNEVEWQIGLAQFYRIEFKAEEVL